MYVHLYGKTYICKLKTTFITKRPNFFDASIYYTYMYYTHVHFLLCTCVHLVPVKGASL